MSIHTRLPIPLQGRLLLRRRKMYVKRFKLTPKQFAVLNQPMVEQLDACGDDMARRILLGVGRGK